MSGCDSDSAEALEPSLEIAHSDLFDSGCAVAGSDDARDVPEDLSRDIDRLERSHVAADYHRVRGKRIAHRIQHPPRIFELFSEAEFQCVVRRDERLRKRWWIAADRLARLRLTPGRARRPG